jgi:hypothetical protein
MRRLPEQVRNTLLTEHQWLVTGNLLKLSAKSREHAQFFVRMYQNLLRRRLCLRSVKCGL